MGFLIAVGLLIIQFFTAFVTALVSTFAGPFVLAVAVVLLTRGVTPSRASRQ